MTTHNEMIEKWEQKPRQLQELKRAAASENTLLRLQPYVDMPKQ